MFKKGREKTGGRKKGVRNKNTTTAKDMLRQVVDSEISILPNVMRNLSPYERVNVLKVLLPYVYPKRQEIDVKSEISALMASIDNLSDDQLVRLKEIIQEIRHDKE